MNAEERVQRKENWTIWMSGIGGERLAALKPMEVKESVLYGVKRRVGFKLLRQHISLCDTV